MKFSESVALLRGWVEIMVTETLEFLEMKIYSPLSVEKIEEKIYNKQSKYFSSFLIW